MADKIELPLERECARKNSDYHKQCLHFDEEKEVCGYMIAP